MDMSNETDNRVRNRRPQPDTEDSSFEKTHPFLSEKTSPSGFSAANEAIWRDVAEITKRRLVSRIDSIVNEHLQDMVNNALECNHALDDTSSDWILDKTQDKQKSHKKGDLPEKVFLFRESMLTDLLKISHIRAVYHMFAAALFLLATETIITDYLDKGSFRDKYHVAMFSYSFGQFPNLVAIWLGMQISTLLVFPFFILWAKNRTKSSNFTLIDSVMLIFYIIYQISFTIFFGYILLELDMPPGSSILLAMELSRFLMKSHAFVRSNASKAFVFSSTDGSKPSESRRESSCAHKNLDETPESELDTDKVRQVLKGIERAPKMSSGSLCPTFQHYLYFLFAPTLIYRDSYPRTSKVRWNFVFSNGIQFVLCVLYTYFIMFRFCFSKFEKMGERSFTGAEVVRLIMHFILPGSLLMYLAFFAFLHSWLNMFAELLRFGDRLFYKDWWNACSMSAYYRTWNVVVHDWLYTYVYLDMYRLTRSRALATTLVFVISAFVHEYILCVTFKFFFPVLLIMFLGAGLLLQFLKTRSRFWNINFFTNMYLGVGIELALYANEWYARRNCESWYPDSFWMDFIVPRSLFCNRISTAGPA